MKIAHLISIGNELTGGRTVDTNSAWLARQLASVGVHCTRHVTIADELEPIRDAMLSASHDADFVIVTGGLGPTPDDLTREALAVAMSVPLELHGESLAHIESYFQSRQRTMYPANRQQAMLPQGTRAIPNPHGTAPGIRATLNRAEFFILPGVPYEMKAMFEATVRPEIASSDAGIVEERVLRTFGMSESEVGERIADLMRRDRNPTVGTSAAELIISIRIVAHGSTDGEIKRLIDADELEIRNRLGDVIFGATEDTLATAAVSTLIDRNLTLSTAESCTGGLIAKLVTDVSGSSACFVQGFVTYANDAKTRLLEVPGALIAANGAVSPQVADAMATNCRRISGTDFAIGVTGIAGPTGGTSDKPVGLVYVALATPTETIVRELRLGDNLRRDQVRDRSAKAALNLLRLELHRSRPSQSMRTRAR
ncbi:MAG: competence/damage-inducible protein A [Phycisphaerae bacterium]|nr:competence/damage-inducible protein A [Phycisphaerae bacterium]